jgi:uncharacterized protein YdaU (DUF1376 family)
MKHPWMPFYPDDFIEATHDLMPEEIGVYLLLLLISWQQKNAALPDDMPWIKRALSRCCTHMHGNRFNRLVPKLLERYFLLDTDGMWRNPRLISERNRAEKFSESQREKVRKRWSEVNGYNHLPDTAALPARTRLQSHIESTTTESMDTKKPSNGTIPVSSELAALMSRKRWL